MCRWCEYGYCPQKAEKKKRDLAFCRRRQSSKACQYAGQLYQRLFSKVYIYICIYIYIYIRILHHKYSFLNKKKKNLCYTKKIKKKKKEVLISSMDSSVCVYVFCYVALGTCASPRPRV